MIKMLGMTSEKALEYSNEIRIWAAAIAAVAATLAFIANYASTRLSTAVAFEKASAERERQLVSNERIASSEAESAKAQRDLLVMKERSKQLAIDLEQEKQKTLQIQKDMTWRTIANRPALIEKLKSLDVTAYIFIESTLDPEAAQYAEEILAVIREAGLKGVGVACRKEAMFGVYLSNTEHKQTRLIFDALTSGGVDIMPALIENAYIPEKMFFVVGSKGRPQGAPPQKPVAIPAENSIE